MLRVVLVQVVLFLLPFVAFAFYLYFNRRDFQDWSEWTPRVTLLAAAGFVLTMIGFFSLVVFEQGSRDAVYRPAQNIDGQIVPGRLERVEDGESEPSQ